MSDRAPVPLAHAGGQVLVGANGSGSPSSSSSTTTGWTIVGHARGNGAGPFAVLEALENLGAAQIQSGIAGEGDALANGVIELDGRHPAADDGARIGASLHALGPAPHLTRQHRDARRAGVAAHPQREITGYCGISYQN